MTPVVSVADLRSALDLLLTEVERQHGPDVDLAEGVYWTVSPGEAYRFDDAPPKVTVGDLVDDVESVRELLSRDPDEGVYVWHDLAHVVGVLTRLAALDLPRET
ncbi:hypothetical protein Ais01nite_48690 [Asanoa ishikariensis]|nr:hypothetical protein Ais01nite_48690 [Asanoa ishikariensis]